MEDQSQLESHLKDNGLDDTEFWLPELEKIGIKSKKSLELLKGDKTSFSELKKKVRNQVEKIALHKLLDIDDTESKNLAKAEEILKQLDEARAEGKKRHDEKVQKLEDDLCKILNIPPDSWISKDKSLDELTKILEAKLNIGGQVQVREVQNDKMLLMKSSGGRALQGILLTKSLDDQLEGRRQLIQVPDVVTITGASQSEDIIESFSSVHEENVYKKTMDMLGRSVAVSSSAPVYGNVAIKIGEAVNYRRETEETSEHHTKEMYSSTVKYSTMEVASYSFKETDLRLSEDAKNDLKELSEIIMYGDSSRINEACERFFYKYGSHANLGPLTYGGYYWWTCMSKGFSERQTDTVKKMQSDAISATGGVSFAGFSVSTKVTNEALKGSYKGKNIDNIIASSTLTVKISGGPTEVADLPKWKNGLVANNSTWILTDRGNKLIAVWDIIKRNHKEEFGQLREVLRCSWEKMTELKAEWDLLGSLSFTPEQVLKQVSEWSNEEKQTPRQIQDRLEYLLGVKTDVSANPGFWNSMYLTHAKVQEFFLSIVHLELDSSHLAHIKFIMEQLVEKDELEQLNTLTFHGIEEFSEWLYEPAQHPTHSRKTEKDISDFPRFVVFLKKTLEEAQLPGSKVSNEALAKSVEIAIHLLRLHYKKSYDDILIAILLYPFQSSSGGNVIVLNPLSRYDLKSLQDSFFEERKKFLEKCSEENILQLQYYLLLLAMEKSHTKSQSKFFMKRITQMMSEVQPPLKQELLEELEPWFDASLVDFREKLESLTSLKHSTTSASHSLMEALQTVPYRHDLDITDYQSKGNLVVYQLLERMGLTEHYLNKITLQDALTIRSQELKLSLSGNHPTDPEQLFNLVLHKLMSYDTRCRSNLMPKTQPDESSHSESDNSDVDSDDSNVDSDDEYVNCNEEYVECAADDDDVDNLHSNTDDDRDNCYHGIHPVDCLLTLFICSDDFLRQDLFSRLAKCQLAIPFIIPDPFTKQLILPLWAMRSIIKDWRATKESEVVDHTHTIVSYPMPVVSFIRFGKYQSRGASKSKILNDIISASDHHDFFFHRDCPGAQYKCLLGEGLVDMSWYLPAGKPTDSFPDAITFLNLHGDARQYPNQCRFLSQISSICFALLTEEDLEYDSQTMESLKAFGSSPGGITILNDAKQISKMFNKKIFPKLRVTSLIGKNASEIKDVIQPRIKSKLSHLKSFKSIEDLCLGEKIILVDENSKFYQEGLTRANKLKTLITSHKSKKNVKQDMLPLQGEGLWKAWAVNDKELHRQLERGNMNVNEYTALIKAKKVSLRSEQLKSIKPLTSVMESFIKSLLSLEGFSNRSQRNYFLQCFKLELNTLSRESIAEMQQDYQSTRKSLLVLQASNDNRDDKSKETEVSELKKLVNLQDNIIDSSFGLEHLLRELGQVYEAALESDEYGNELSRLPKAAAELLIDGYPLEIINGDAAHVPLQWVTAVLKEAVEILGDPKVFVLSVLGLQSTGKSTMLNTAFGVQFNVSAGQCTRGAFMQLLPLDEEIKRKTKCGYVLIVDTEGLRAPELDPEKAQKHDNELATFVIGLANTTLINIYGEVAGDMDDILQTSVHAFLRMTQVKHHPSCQFVHQNAAINIRGEVGRARFAHKLNRFTLDAAREEECEGQYKTFSDVIKFDDQMDVHYFPGLWKGDPPLAPVNQGYSTAAQMLKDRVIKIIHESAATSNLSLSSFQTRVSDLWNSLLKEKFVFSFKNTLEITAYNSLETAYLKWEWSLQEAILKWEQQTENEIDTEPPETVSDLVQQKTKDLQVYLKKHSDQIKKKMKEFFSGKQSEILVQWKAKFECRFATLSEDLTLRAEALCRKLLANKRAISEFKLARERDANFIKVKVQEHIEGIKQEQENLNNSLERRQLEPDQLKILLERNLFTYEKLTKYINQQLITPDQEQQIRNAVQKSGGKLTENSLKHILVGGVLTVDQVKKIMKRTQLTEQELEIKFGAIWIAFISQLPPTQIDIMLVADEVEKSLTKFVRAKGHEGLLIHKLQAISLNKRAAELDLRPNIGTHYNKVCRFITRGFDYVSRKLHFTTDPYKIEAIEITQKVFEKVSTHVQNILKKDTDFNPIFTTELLHLVDEKITVESIRVKAMFNFTPEYRVDMYLTACSFVIPKFEDMAKLFKERNDPRLYLEKNVRDPEFIKFKNQYYQTEAEEAIADTLCAYLAQPIKVQIANSIGAKIVGVMKSSQHHFSSKMALKVKVFTDLHKMDEFKKYIVYIQNVELCLESNIVHYTMEYCNWKEPGTDNTRLQLLSKDEVTRFVGVIESVVTDLNETNVHQWMLSFCKNKKLRSELGVDLEPDDMINGYSSSQKLDLDNFKLKIRNGLTELKKKLHDSYGSIQCEEEMAHWKDKPHELLQSLIGCTARCPFCGEQCDLLDPNHSGEKHRTEVHRVDCLAGWHYIDNVMTTDSCQALVASDKSFYKHDGTLHPYKEYNKLDVYKDWSIPPDMTSQNCLFWKWFVAKYSQDLADEYSLKPPEVPDEWHNIKWPEVEKNLKEIYKL